jgi:hypothetical protein
MPKVVEVLKCQYTRQGKRSTKIIHTLNGLANKILNLTKTPSTTARQMLLLLKQLLTILLVMA